MPIVEHRIGNSINIVVHNLINQHLLCPTPRYLTKGLLDLLLTRNHHILSPIACKKLSNKALTHPMNASLHLISELPFVAGKQPRLILKRNDTTQSTLRGDNQHLPFDSILPISHCQSRHLSWSRLKKYFFPIFELDGVEPLVDTFT